MKNIFGSNPITSVAGYLLAGLYAAQLIMQAGPVSHWTQWAVPVGIAILGRVAGDSANTQK